MLIKPLFSDNETFAVDPVPCIIDVIPTEFLELPILIVPSFTIFALSVANIPKLSLEAAVPSLSTFIVAPERLVAIAYLVLAPEVEEPFAIIPIAPCPVSFILALLITSVLALEPS